MKLRLKKMAVKAVNFVLDAIIEHAVLAIGALFVGAVRKGIKGFRAKRALMKAEQKPADVIETDTKVEAEEVTGEVVEETAAETEDIIEETPVED